MASVIHGATLASAVRRSEIPPNGEGDGRAVVFLAREDYVRIMDANMFRGHVLGSAIPSGAHRSDILYSGFGFAFVW